VDTDDPRGLTPARRGAPSRRAWVSDPGLAIGVTTTILGLLLLLASPAAAADPLPVPLPSLPVPVPTLPLPTLPLPTLPPLPTPTLPPLPTPTLPVPTPTLRLPTPTLPLPTPTPTPSASAPISPSPLPSTFGAGPINSATSLGSPFTSPPVTASGPAESISPTVGGGGSPFNSFVVPGLIVGVPAVIILGILVAQLAVGAAWMPVIRRWLNRRV
jgi:hypothetical protein